MAKKLRGGSVFDPFTASEDFAIDFGYVWDQPPRCRYCGEPVLAGELVRWTGEAPWGLAHEACHQQRLAKGVAAGGR